MKRNKKTQLNLLLISVIITIAILLYWIWLFYMTQPATDSNTYQCHEIITNVKVRAASHRGTDKLLLFTDDHCYMLDTGWKNENASTELAEQIHSAKEALTLTVWEHFPKQLFDSCSTSLTVRQVADIRSDSNTYWDVSTHNNYQQSERVSGIIAGVFLSVVIVVFDFLVWCAERRGRFRCPLSRT